MRVNQKDLADIFGVTDRTIRNWNHEGMPKNTDIGESYDTTEVLSWYTKKRNGNSPMAARARKDEAQTEKLLFELETLKENYINKDEYFMLCGNAVQKMKIKLLSMPTQLASVAMNASTLNECETKAREIVVEALNELANISDEKINNEFAEFCSNIGTMIELYESSTYKKKLQ